jgi:hypothetical protein
MFQMMGMFAEFERASVSDVLAFLGRRAGQVSREYGASVSACSPSAFSVCRVSASFLRTTPARKPCTEWDCQPVAAMMAAMVAPCGRFSSATTAACFDLARVLR